MITDYQIRAARAWIEWTREQLARAANVSAPTIRNLESGKVAPRSAVHVQLALEKEGFVFHWKGGLNRLSAESKTFDGPDSCNRFFEELLTSTKLNGGELIAVCKNQKMLCQSLGIDDKSQFDRLMELAKHASIKCLLSEEQKVLQAIPGVQFRATLHKPIGNTVQFIHADKTALVMCTGSDFIIYITKSTEVTQSNLSDFHSRWESAIPIAA